MKTGQKTITTAGSRVALGTDTVNGPILIKAMSTNSGLVYVGDSTVSSSNGYELSAGDVVTIDMVGDLDNIWLDASANTQKVCYIVCGIV